MRLRERALVPQVGAPADAGHPGNNETVRHGGALLASEGVITATMPLEIAKGIRVIGIPSFPADTSTVALKSEAYPKPSPAPLPSLPAAFSRRAALFGAVASTGFLGAAGVAAVAKGDAATELPCTADAQLMALCDKLHDNKAAGDDLCGAYPGVDCDSVPGWFKLEGKRSVLLYQITEIPAVTLAGIAAKARVLQVDTVRQDYEWADVLSASIAEDILRIHGGANG